MIRKSTGHRVSVPLCKSSKYPGSHLSRVYCIIIIGDYFQPSTLKFDSITVCGGIFGATSIVQYIESILNNATYSFDQDCHFEIRSSVKRVVLTFEELHFEGEVNCKRDYIELSEYISNKNVPIAKICSTEDLNKTYYSNVSRMFLHFHTNGNSTYKGFKASFRGELKILVVHLINFTFLTVVIKFATQNYICTSIVIFETESNN